MKQGTMAKWICLVLAILALALPALAQEATGAPAVVLAGNPTTGYTWAATVADENIVAVVDDGFAQDEAAEGMTGAGGFQRFSFQGKAEGETTVTFAYGRSWETEEPVYTLTYDIAVDADLTVTIVTTTFSAGGA